ncbi:MarR family winged helix-turn-helix transcriptional regulator [Kutzneria kofuensis]|uniref:DNA-binding MarR family transcriptional regulator n=1 Tax=Kutzneria kofuensis TaxID=103725 RepID=A0A7W9KE74_9PSEU|nr:MarR family transcriptional regulator [Kutzneria kofuensis]MBB5890832.1 DNA-binding MarR family transcriptional regulator [Kutzneria kofuensis]
MEDKEQLIASITATQRSLGRVFGAARANPLMSLNLTMRQLKVLLTLARRGPTAGQELTAEMGVSLATVTGIVDRLAAQGLVSRREDPSDRRVRLLELTAEGHKLVGSVVDAGSAQYRRLLSRLEVDELRLLDSLIRRMAEIADEEFRES